VADDLRAFDLARPPGASVPEDEEQKRCLDEDEDPARDREDQPVDLPDAVLVRIGRRRWREPAVPRRGDGAAREVAAALPSAPSDAPPG
jgi:hypothetical protein